MCLWICESLRGHVYAWVCGCIKCVYVRARVRVHTNFSMYEVNLIICVFSDRFMCNVPTCSFGVVVIL